MLSCGIGAVERSFALAAVEAGHVAAGEHGPHHAVAIDIEAAWGKALYLGARRVPRDFVVFGESRVGGIRTRNHAYNRAGEAQNRSPNGAILGTDGYAVEADIEALVLGGIDRLVRFDVGVALAVAIGIENKRRPALRFFFVVSLVPQLGVQPADRAAATTAAGPQGVVRVFGELQVVSAETRPDERHFLGLGIVDGQVASGVRQ